MERVLSAKAQGYLHKLCVEIPNRRIGGAGNRAATDFFADVVASFGFAVESAEFDCIDWRQDGAELSAGGARFEAFASPYSLGCRVSAPLTVVSSVEELEAAAPGDEVLLLRGEIASGQLMPKNFPFYNPDEHRRIIRALEARAPRAIIAATSRDEMAGAVYPFSLIEDGDFDIPSVYMTDVEGARLAEYTGQVVDLESRAERIPSTGRSVVARKGADSGRRAVLFAHIDTKMSTPGAADNAGGVIVLLLLAELLADTAGNLLVEIVPMNGEDYYAAPGERQYLAMSEGYLTEIILGINIDGVGYRQGSTAYSLYHCPEGIAGRIHGVFSAYDDIVEGSPWYQGDHGLFLMKGIPALALTSDDSGLSEFVHSPHDKPEIVDPARLVTVAQALRDLLLSLES